ncbi:SDR family NAD(P)-dependent oxidoreductase, partial [uncultured Erythrobacter sp.]|uniref:SDR family NAD(P)-dependent oxidoreductase n=1 Tax=uncultured Erythrobacter sp. TaxID=263913 RepID=UPI002627DAF5
MNGLNEKVALIFAGSRGIGRATALGLAKEKAIVGVGYVSNKEAANEVVSAIELAGGTAYAFHSGGITNDSASQVESTHGGLPDSMKR